MPVVETIRLSEEWTALPSLFMLASSEASPGAEGKLGIPAHIALIEDFILEALAEGQRTKKTQLLTIEAPVRHGKSVFTTWHLPVWLLGTSPHLKIGVAGYGQDFASEWGEKSRDTMEEFGPSFGVRVSRTSSSKSHWKIERHGGSMQCFGIGGSITGKGYHLIVIDDPIKNPEEADSETYRTRNKRWLQGAILPRLDPGAVCVLMMARWHEDDLIGWAHREMKGRWKRLRLPAIAEETSDTFGADPLGREPGEALWPEVRSVEMLEQYRKDSGDQMFNALYQQRPSPPAGAILQRGWWKEYTRRPSIAWFDAAVMSWDMTFKETKSGSFVVGQVWGRKGADFYLLHQVRERMDFPSTKAALRQMAAHPEWGRAPRRLVEDKANGPAIISELRREIPGLIAVPATTSKEARAAAVSSYVEAGNVYLPSPELAPWVGEFIEEASSFPNGLHDDQVDAFSQAVMDLAKNQVRRAGTVGGGRRAA
jgi:predicted phage terminase large subunit-like protein